MLMFAICELEGGRRRATDPVWSLGRSVTKPDEPVLYYLKDGPPRGFVREELLVVPPDTQLPPDGFSSAEQFINVRIHLSSANRKGVFVPIGQRVHPIFCDPAPGVEG